MVKFKCTICQLTLMLLIAIVLSSCTGDMDEVKRYVSEVKQRPADPVDPVPPIASYTPVKYMVDGMRNPFIENIVAVQRPTASPEVAADPASYTGPQPDLDRPTEYLEKFSLDTLKMVGTFSNASFEWALVQDLENIVHRVEIGDFLGQNRGKIIAISDDRIEISEMIPNGNQGWLVRDASIALEE